jgi:hypothetical protein
MEKSDVSANLPAGSEPKPSVEEYKQPEEVEKAEESPEQNEFTQKSLEQSGVAVSFLIN